MKKSKIWPTLITIAVVGGSAFTAKSTGAFSSEPETKLAGATVMRGPLRISVIERGNLKAADSATLKSELEGSATVLYLIEEGTHVKEGELVCELDSSELIDRKIQQEIKVQNASASYTKAKQTYEIQQSQNLSDIARAEQVVEFAKIDRKKYDEGDMPQLLEKAKEDIVLRQEERERAVQDLEWSEKLAERGFLEQSELDADRLAKTRAEIQYEQAVRAEKLLVEYEIPRAVAELEADVEEAGRELERVKLQATARIADYEADMSTSKAKLKLETDELDKIESQIAKAVMYAPTDGMVVYAVESSHRWGSGTPMQEGTQVRERQEIITIPSEKGYVAEASLHESVLEKVTTGMPCLVTVDALKSTFRGRVGFKAVLPDQNSWFANPDLRVYRTTIEVIDKDARMRPGMSCSIEILVDELMDATFVPVQSVFLDAGNPIALVSEHGEITKRPVTIGDNNGKWVEIKDGLTEGEEVLLSLPSNIALEPAPENNEIIATSDWPEGKPKPKAPRASGDEIRGERGKSGSHAPEKGGADHAEREGGSGLDAAKIEKWKQENPEQYKAMQDAMDDPEKKAELMKKWREGGGQAPGGEAGSQ